MHPKHKSVARSECMDSLDLPVDNTSHMLKECTRYRSMIMKGNNARPASGDMLLRIQSGFVLLQKQYFDAITSRYGLLDKRTEHSKGVGDKSGASGARMRACYTVKVFGRTFTRS